MKGMWTKQCVGVYVKKDNNDLWSGYAITFNSDGYKNIFGCTCWGCSLNLMDYFQWDFGW